jgi:diguanylate cyclase (GGDEF)-like protein
MAPADMDIANLDTKALFKTQVINSINVLYSIYPGIHTYVYILDNRGHFKLRNLPSNEDHMIETLSAEMSLFIIIESQKHFSSQLISSEENDDIFVQNSLDKSSNILMSPIGHDDSLAGFLLTIIPEDMDVSQLDMDVFDTLAMSIGSNYIATELLDRYEKRSKHLSVMLEVNTHLNMAATKADYLNEISRFGKYFIEFDRAVLVLQPEDMPDYFLIDYIEGEESGLQLGMSYPMYNSVVSRSLTSGQYFIYKKSQEELPEGLYRAGDTDDYPYDQVVGFPLARVNNAPGVLILESKTEHSVKQSEINIFEMISQSLGAALTRFSLFERLTNYATIDTLTNLYNLRALKQRFEEELARAKRYQNFLVVLFLDLDKFKLVNDTHGHLMGDHVLRETAQIIRDSIRTSDIPGRYGGEEFVVIMVNTDAASCMASAQRICEAIYKHKYEMNAISIQNRISIGMAEYPKDGETMLDLIQSADTAMYSAKEQGGNQVVKFKTGMAPKSKQ